jgi:cytochrome c2
MQDMMKELNIPPVRFEGNEMADIIAYLYFVNYFDHPGDANRGREIFFEKQCIHCHSITPSEPSIGPDLSKSTAVGSPIEIISAMWNHAKRMEPAMTARGIPWPRFEVGEMSHLVEFIRTHSEKH